MYSPAGKLIVDSALSESLVNVFRGTGKILMAPERHKFSVV